MLYPKSEKGEALIPVHGLIQFVRSDPVWNVNMCHPLRLYILYSYTQATAPDVFQIDVFKSSE